MGTLQGGQSFQKLFRVLLDSATKGTPKPEAQYIQVGKINHW